MLDMDLFLSELKTSILAIEMRNLGKIESTNIVAKQMVEDGAQEGLIVVADQQTAGQGRFDRKWYSPKGGLYFSIIVRPRIAADKIPLLTLLTSCAVADSLKSLYQLDAKLKWPNDILTNERKLGGILSEVVTKDNEIIGVVIGVGINLNMKLADMPAELTNLATSTLEELGHEITKEKVLAGIINGIDRRLLKTESESSFTHVLDEWRMMSSTLHRRVSVDDGNTTFTGVAIEITNNGALKVRTSDGDIVFQTGDVVHLRS